MNSSEYIYEMTPQGDLTGASKPRHTIHQEGAWHRSVHIWVLNDKDELLIQQRSLEKESHPGLWDVSCAGHIQSGDSSLQAALRELKEELGLAIRPGDLEMMFTVESQFILNNGTYKDNELVDVYLLRKNVNVQALHLQPGEVASAKMISIDDFCKLAACKDSSFVPHWKAYQNLLDYLDKSISKLY
ncbi:MAG: NUDIX domain-containing protein [Desulfobacterales bacterium]|nr:NUDIX domain-containing protein [Desulfobacterales bacterium]